MLCPGLRQGYGAELLLWCRARSGHEALRCSLPRSVRRRSIHVSEAGPLPPPLPQRTMRRAITCQFRRPTHGCGFCKRRIDFETIGFRHLAGEKRKVSALNIKQGSLRVVLARTFLEHHARVVRDFESRAVEKINAHPTVGASLDDVAAENSIADFERSKNLARPRDRRRTGHQCNLADSQ